MTKGVIFTIIGTIVLIGLLLWSNSLRGSHVPTFRDTTIACLTNGHVSLADHIHPELKITVDGVNENIPANIGIDPTCMSEIHTHDETGMIHAETITPGKVQDFRLTDFFTIWDKNPQREGFNLEILQDGEIKQSVADVTFVDHSVIELKYTSVK